MLSVQKHNPGIPICLLVDSDTAATLVGFRASVKDLAAEVVALDTPKEYNGLQTSRYLKTTMRKWIKGNFLYLDGDTIICESLAEISDVVGEVSAVWDIHVPFSENINGPYLSYKINKLGWHASINNEHFNGGVLFVRDTPVAHDFFTMWNTLWQESLERGVSIDQPALSETNYRNQGVIKAIDGKWNCQVNYGTHFLHTAAVLHYFGSNQGNTLPYKMTNASLLSTFKKEEKLSPKLLEILENPKSAFNSSLIIADKEILTYIRSPFFKFTYSVFEKRGLLYKVHKVYSMIASKLKNL